MTEEVFTDLVRKYLEARGHPPMPEVVLLALVKGLAKPSEYSKDKAYELACFLIATEETQDEDVEATVRRQEEEMAKPRPRIRKKWGWW